MLRWMNVYLGVQLRPKNAITVITPIRYPLDNCGYIYIYLVGGIPTPLKNHGVRQLGLLFPICGKSSNSMVPVTTNQIWLAGWHRAVPPSPRRWLSPWYFPSSQCQQVRPARSPCTSARPDVGRGFSRAVGEVTTGFLGQKEQAGASEV